MIEMSLSILWRGEEESRSFCSRRGIQGSRGVEQEKENFRDRSGLANRDGALFC